MAAQECMAACKRCNDSGCTGQHGGMHVDQDRVAADIKPSRWRTVTISGTSAKGGTHKLHTARLVRCVLRKPVHAHPAQQRCSACARIAA